jgi:transketolase
MKGLHCQPFIYNKNMEEAMDIKALEKKAAEVRIGIVKAIHNAGSGHPGGSLSAADIVTALYFAEMNVNADEPEMKGRDKFILSKGHAGPAQYSALALKGYFPMEDFMTLRKLGSKFQGHPDMNKVPGIEMSTGSLGQGFSAAGGMAMANKLDNDPGRIYTLLGDGEIQEGIVWEAAMSVAHYKLDNMVGILDYNGLQIDGKNEDVITVAPVADKFRAFGWNVIEINGHDFEQILDAFAKARACKGKPTMIIAATVKGKGVSFMENNAGWHGKAPNDDETKQAIAELGGTI